MIILFDDGNKKLTQEKGVNKNTKLLQRKKRLHLEEELGGGNFIMNKESKATIGM